MTGLWSRNQTLSGWLPGHYVYHRFLNPKGGDEVADYQGDELECSQGFKSNLSLLTRLLRSNFRRKMRNTPTQICSTIRDKDEHHEGHKPGEDMNLLHFNLETACHAASPQPCFSCILVHIVLLVYLNSACQAQVQISFELLLLGARLQGTTAPSPSWS